MSQFFVFQTTNIIIFMDTEERSRSENNTSSADDDVGENEGLKREIVFFFHCGQLYFQVNL